MTSDRPIRIDDLTIKDEEISEPTLFTISILISVTKLNRPVNSIDEALNRIQATLEQNWGFRKRWEDRDFREGFLAFQKTDDTLEFLYGRESSFKLDFVTDNDKPEMMTKRIRTLDSSHRVMVRLNLHTEYVEVVLSGGHDPLLFKVSELVNIGIRELAGGTGHETLETLITKEGMLEILKSFGSDVEYIYADPWNSELLRKSIKKKGLEGEIIEQTEYDVHAIYRGFKITSAPVVRDLLRDTGIYVKEIQGKIINEGHKITLRIGANGKITFFISRSVLGEVTKPHDLAYDLYKKIIAGKTLSVVQKTLDGYNG